MTQFDHEKPAKGENPLTDGFQKWVLEVLDEWKVPGVSVAVVDDNQIFTQVSCIINNRRDTLLTTYTRATATRLSPTQLPLPKHSGTRHPRQRPLQALLSRSSSTPKSIPPSRKDGRQPYRPLSARTLSFRMSGLRTISRSKMPSVTAPDFRVTIGLFRDISRMRTTRAR